MGISGDSLLLDENSICNSFNEVINRVEYIEKSLGEKNVVLIQEFIENAREYTTLIVGNHVCNDILSFTIKVTPIKFYDFEQKNYSNAPVEEYYHKCDLENTELLKNIESKLIYLKKVTDCKDYVRYDWLLNQDDEFYLLDLNANPSFDSSVFRLYKEFYEVDGSIMGHIIKSALKR
jgi:D-alanine-D-alanine ligase-like ATP-grasp enzyme